jgi:hypothetical protein
MIQGGIKNPFVFFTIALHLYLGKRLLPGFAGQRTYRFERLLCNFVLQVIFGSLYTGK